MNITTWNTKRQYSMNGQRISAVILDNGTVMFADIDRGIDGVTNRQYHAALRDFIGIQEFVMTEYDNGRISYGSWSYRETQGMDYSACSDFYEKRDAIMQSLKAAAKAI